MMPVYSTASSTPLGTIQPYSADTAPTSSWLLCDGSAVSRTTYAALFALIGTVYGVGDGSTTFNVPDLRGRMPVGKGTHADVNTLGGNDGAPTADRRPKHKHTVNDPGHSHTTPFDSPGSNPNVYGDVALGLSGVGTVTSGASGTGVTVGLQSNTPTDTPAYLVVQYIIRAIA